MLRRMLEWSFYHAGSTCLRVADVLFGRWVRTNDEIHDYLDARVDAAEMKAFLRQHPEIKQSTVLVLTQKEIAKAVAKAASR